MNILTQRVKRLFGLDIVATTAKGALDLIEARFEKGPSLLLGFANAHMISTACKNDTYASVLQKFVLLNDGVGADLAARLLTGSAFPENLNGTDFTPQILKKFPEARYFLYGARRDVVAKAAEILTLRYGVHVVGFHDGFSGSGADAAAMIRVAEPDIVLVALGNPLQESWIARHADETNARLLVGVGAWFDFLTGEVPRAPVWVRQLRLEWVFRLMCEPRRLFRRYTVETAGFLMRVVLELMVRNKGRILPP